MRSPPTWRNRDKKRPDPAIATADGDFATGGAATGSARSCAGHAVSALDDGETGAASLSRRSPAIGRKREALTITCPDAAQRPISAFPRLFDTPSRGCTAGPGTQNLE